MQHLALRTDEDFSVIFNCKDTEVGARGGGGAQTSVRLISRTNREIFSLKNFLERSMKNWPISRTGYQKLAQILERGINFSGIFLEPIWNPGRHIPTQKIPKFPPGSRCRQTKTLN